MKAFPLLAATMALAALPSCRRAQAPVAQSAPEVTVDSVVTDSVTLFRDYPGTLVADRTVQVVGRVSGTVSGPLYTSGDYVRAGQLLFTIDSPDARNALAEAEASLAQARSTNAYAEEHYSAMARALESNAVSKMEVAQALSARDQSRAAIRNAEAALAQARVRMGYCRVTAPVSGHITENAVSGGSYIAGDVQPVTLATVYDDAVMDCYFAIEDASFQRMFLNPNGRDKIDYSAIPVHFSEELPHRYTADLTYLAPNVDASTGTMNLMALIDNKWGELKAGMYLTVRLPYKVEPQAMLVRSASLGTDQLGQYLYVVNDSDKVVYTPVKTGDIVADTMRIVTSGLRPGQRYVSQAMLKVRDGMKVRPVVVGSESVKK